MIGPTEADLLFWALARATGIGAFAALAIALLSGIALRTATLDWLATNRALKALHTWTQSLWLPLGGLHLLTIWLDRTARVGLADLVVPFGVGYGSLAVGLGTLAFDAFVLVAITAWARRWMDLGLWRWIHRAGYLAYAFTFAHAVLSGSDFSSPAISAIAWATAFGLAVLTLSRVLWGRLPG